MSTMSKKSKGLFVVLPAAVLSVLLLPMLYAQHTVESALDDSGDTTLRHIIEQVAQDGDNIEFALPSGINTITLTQGLPIVIDAENLSIDGGSSGIIIDGNAAAGIFGIDEEISMLTLNNMTLQNGLAEAGGAINYVSLFGNDLEIKNTGTLTFVGNEAEGDGGAIYFNSFYFDIGTFTSTFGNLVLGNGIEFSENVAKGGGGGAIYAIGNVAIGDNAKFAGNKAEGDVEDLGGGTLIYLGLGGAICADEVNLGKNAIFTQNVANFDGGAIYSYGGAMLSDNAEFVGNEAGRDGGAIYALLDDVALGDNATFTGNTAKDGGGGAIYAWGGDVRLDDNAAFIGNKALGTAKWNANINDYEFFAHGGAIYAHGDGDITLGKNAEFAGNEATFNGGAIDSSMGNVTLGRGAVFTNNRAGGDGGAIYVYDNITLHGGTFFTGNSAGNAGGAIYNVGSISPAPSSPTTLTLDTTDGDIVFAGNTAKGEPNSIHLNQNAALYLGRDARTLGTTGGENNIYFDDPISSGTGGGNILVKQGSGFVQFLGNNDLNTTGVTGKSVEVESGTFRVADNAAFDATGGGEFSVGTYAELAGQGTIKADSFTIAGVISPDAWTYSRYDQGMIVSERKTGEATGTLTLEGDADFENTSMFDYQIDLKGGNNYDHDLLVVEKGNVTIKGGTLEVGLFGRGVFEAGTTMQVIGNNNLTGTFTPGGDYAEDYELTSDANGLWIEWLNTVMVLGEEDIFAGKNHAMKREVSAEMQRRFVDRLPSASVRMRWNDAVIRGVAPCNSVQSRNIESRSLPTSPSWNRWASITGDWFHRSNIGVHSGYDLSSAGVIAGMDKNITRNTFFGGAFAYNNGYLDFQNIRAADQIDAFRFALYGGWNKRNVYADVYAGYAKTWHDSKREVPRLAGAPVTARSKYNDNMLSTGVEFGHKYGALTPSIGLHYIHLYSPSVTEMGADADNFHYYGGSYNSLRMPMGAKLSWKLYSRSGIVFTPEFRAYYVREFLDDSARAVVSFNNVRSVNFLASGGNWGRNSARFGAGLNASLSDWLNFRIDYDYEVYNHTATNALGATLGVKW